MEKVKLDKKDLKLLYWLDQDSRATNKALGKKVGLTEQAIGYKIKRLCKKGVIKKFVTFINTPGLGYMHYKVFLKLNNISEQVENNLRKMIVNNQHIRWGGMCSGKYDITFSILARNPLHFAEIYNAIEKKFGKYIIGKNVFQVIKAPGFSRDFLIGKKESKELAYDVSETPQKVDHIDKKIMKAISQNSRKNIVDIAKETNTTVDIVKYRLKKLKQKGIITGFTIHLDLVKMGYEYYSTFFYTYNVTPEVQKQMISFVQMHPNILFFARILGSHDLQMEFEVEDYEQLEEYLKEFRQQFGKYIQNFEILRMTKQFKYDFYPFEVKN